jgi:3-deoxy-D-manno-octulosonic acid (KDO) 8-phosphate synthase
MALHPYPDQTFSDKPNMVPLHRLEDMYKQILAINTVATVLPFQSFL